ncbi:hypothetical protein JAAARDRAFT_197691 [Jaapia argillacea MUCL 33604]|uniref:Uncharacterized protein n=1 Tax=Jaapia argillacea MUCL 33604 TaxID=933084 RepID=A0A067PH96_9AGAM|nr:hypothetical protein JAAARDRAFT_197691 [Jaapia argillacea MUCL 33604]
MELRAKECFKRSIRVPGLSINLATSTPPSLATPACCEAPELPTRPFKQPETTHPATFSLAYLPTLAIALVAVVMGYLLLFTTPHPKPLMRTGAFTKGTGFACLFDSVHRHLIPPLLASNLLGTVRGSHRMSTPSQAFLPTHHLIPTFPIQSTAP